MCALRQCQLMALLSVGSIWFPVVVLWTSNKVMSLSSGQKCGYCCPAQWQLCSDSLYIKWLCGWRRQKRNNFCLSKVCVRQMLLTNVCLLAMLIMMFGAFLSFFHYCDWHLIFMFAQRLIDKKMATYASVAKSTSKEMCDIVFCQLPSGEMKGLLSLILF